MPLANPAFVLVGAIALRPAIAKPSPLRFHEHLRRVQVDETGEPVPSLPVEAFQPSRLW